MIGTTLDPVQGKTLDDLLERIGSVPAERIPDFPPPGTATEAHLFLQPGGEKRLYELVDGVLVEKPMGYYESLLASVLNYLLRRFLEDHDLGIVLGADATLRIETGLVRLPDVCFIGWDHFPGRLLPRKPVPDLVPDLAVEILSESNTGREMDRKVSEYFQAGVQLVWYVYPETRSVEVYTGPRALTLLHAMDTLDGSVVLPGFQLSISEWFARAGQRSE